MKIKSKFTIYNIIMLITPILLIGVISVCFVLIFILKFPVEELNISRPSMLDPYVFSQAVGEFFKSNPECNILCGVVAYDMRVACRAFNYRCHKIDDKKY